MAKKTEKDFLVDRYAELYGLTKIEARDELDRFPDFVTRMLLERGEINFMGFFKFKRYDMPERRYIDFDGVEKHADPKVKVNCKIGKMLKEFAQGEIVIDA